MPSFVKHSKGIQKPHFTPHKPIFYVPEKQPISLHSHFNANDFNYFVPPFAPFAPPPTSSVFNSNDCIWYYGTVYVKEATAVAKLHGMHGLHEHEPIRVNDPVNDSVNDSVNDTVNDPVNPAMDDNNDDDESVSSCSGKRNVGKQNQLAHLKDGMRLRHIILSNANDEWHEWCAMFDAEANRIIRTPDGVAFDTLRQFARLHHNEVWGTPTVLANVLTDPHFQFKDDADDQWHPLSNLKKK